MQFELVADALAVEYYSLILLGRSEWSMNREFKRCGNQGRMMFSECIYSCIPEVME